jgi:SPP1 family phage portal protein
MKRENKMTELQTNKYYNIVHKEYIETGELSDDTIRALINDHEHELERIQNRMGRFKNKRENGVPIFERNLVIRGKNYDDQDPWIDRKINIDYFSKLINIKRGFIFGKPATYKFDEEQIENVEDKQERLNRFFLINNIENKDSETGKIAGIAGYAVRHLYYDDIYEEVRVKNLDPQEVIFIDKSKYNIIDAEYSARIYELQQGYKIFEFYTPDKVQKYEITETKTMYTVTKEYDNIFSAQPNIGYANNGEFMGDADRVLELIDAVDVLVSDVSTETAKFRLAYLILKNFHMTEEKLKKLQKPGAIEVGDDGEVKWLTKDIDYEGVIKFCKEMLHKNIYEMSNIVDLTNDAFKGNQTKAAVEQKLLDFITKCSNTWRSFTESNRQMFKLLFDYWNFSSGNKRDFSYLYIEQTYNKNFPLNLKAEAEIADKLAGKVSKRTIWEKVFSFIKDPDKEEQRLKEEQGEQVDFDKALDKI